MPRILTLLLISIAASIGVQAQVLPQLKREKPDLEEIRLSLIHI